MKANIHILNAGGRLTKISKKINDESEKTIRRVGKVLDYPDIDIAILDNPWGAIPETGVGGFAHSPNLIQISIDPKHKNIGFKLVGDYRIKNNKLASDLVWKQAREFI